MENNSNGVNYLFLIWLILFAAKVTGHVDWSWWIVNIPLYPFALAFGIVFAAIAILSIVGIIVGVGIFAVSLYEEICKRL